MKILNHYKIGIIHLADSVKQKLNRGLSDIDTPEIKKIKNTTNDVF